MHKIIKYYTITIKIIMFIGFAFADIKTDEIALNLVQDKNDYTSLLAKTEKISILLAIVEDSFKALGQVSSIVKNSLERTDQFKVTIKSLPEPRNKNEVQGFFNEGFEWVIFLTQNSNDKSLEWRIYDPIDAVMLKGKKVLFDSSLLDKYSHKNISIKELAYKLADQLWVELMQSPSCFMSKIAYIKRKKSKDLTLASNSIYLCDYDGSDHQKLVDDGKIYVNTYWTQNSFNPCLLCSEFTDYNVRLVAFNVARCLLGSKQKKVFLELDGTFVGISCAKNSRQAVYCRSGDIWHYGYNNKYKKGVYTRVIKNNGKNSNPILLENGDIIFCSNSRVDQPTKKYTDGPKICYYHKDSKKINLITNSGYCISPTYCASSNKIIYSKKTKGIFQLYSYDMISKNHKQLTYSKGNKVDACCSPCGSYIAFCYNEGHRSRGSQIALFHKNTNKVWFITSKDEDCCYPSWSPKLETLL